MDNNTNGRFYMYIARSSTLASLMFKDASGTHMIACKATKYPVDNPHETNMELVCSASRVLAEDITREHDGMRCNTGLNRCQMLSAYDALGDSNMIEHVIMYGGVYTGTLVHKMG